MALDATIALLLPAEVQEFIAERPDIAAEFPHIVEVIGATFDRPSLVFHVVPPAEDDPETLLAISVMYREDRDGARALRRKLLDGPWQDLDRAVTRVVTVHLDGPVEQP